ncbi:MAG: serine/threonine protein kinase [Burkholderiales bacterium]
MTSTPPPQPPDDTVPANAARRGGNALPEGTRLAEFEIRSVIGEGGFGIVYLAWDGSLQRQVAIKEYMPATLAARTQASRVMPRSDKSAETFALGLRSFVNEAHLLASFDHPSLLKVYRFWEANGTAYMVMPYYQGITLKRALAALKAPPEEGWLLRHLGQLLDALDVMHRGHCFHRDIAPDNILLLDDGTPLLLDFGAARRVIGDATHALTAFLKPGYAPVEQYAEMPSMKQGPWTDLYALGSVVHYAITGRTPPESVARLVNDTMVPLAQAAAGRYSERFLRAIDHALAVRPDDRTHSATEMRTELGVEERRSRARKSGQIPTAPMPLEGAAAAADEVTMPPYRPPPLLKPLPPLQPVAAEVVSRQTLAHRVPPQRVAWLLAAALGLTAAAGLGWWWLSNPGAGVAPAEQARQRVQTPAAPTATDERNTALPAASTADDGAVPRALGATAPAAVLEPGPTSAAPSAAPVPPGPAATPEPAARERPPATAVSTRPIPKKNSPNPRCTDIIARVSLGEELSAQDHATLERECRK